MMKAGKQKWLRDADPRLTLIVALGMIVIGLSLLPGAHSSARQFGVGFELGLAGVVLLLGVLRAARHMWRRPR